MNPINLIRWFESKQNLLNIATIVLALGTFAASNLGMLGLSDRNAFLVTAGLILINNSLQIWLRNTTTDIVASKAVIEANTPVVGSSSPTP